MKRNMYQWVDSLKTTGPKRSTPVLSFPSVQLMGITVRDLISSSELQSKGMKLVADRVPSGASVSLMDLSLELNVSVPRFVSRTMRYPLSSALLSRQKRRLTL